jgi:amino acid adenylation domain-containing protein
VNVRDFVAELQTRGINLWADGDQLHCSAPEGVLTTEVRDALTRRKPELLAYLRDRVRPGEEEWAGKEIQRVPRDQSLPLSFAQERLWFFDQLEPGSHAYNIAATLRLVGPLDIDLLQRSLDYLVGRHESLRTCVVASGGRPDQLVAPSVHLPVERIETFGMGMESRQQFALAKLAERARQPFDLEQAPLIRVALAEVAQAVHLLGVVAHHIVVDGASLGILLREWAIVYSAFQRNATPSLARLPIQYADFAAWQRRALSDERQRHHLEYWRQKLGTDLAPVEVPVDYERPKVQRHEGERCETTLSASLTSGLRHLGRSAGTTLFMTLLAGFEVLLHRVTGSPEVTLGFPIAGRNRPEVEGLVGMFVNTLVQRSDLASDQSFRTVLAGVREATLEAYSHQDLPFERLVEALQPTRDLSRTPLFQVLFNMVPQAPPNVEGWADLDVTVEPATDVPSHFDLTLYAGEDRETLNLLLVYNSSLYATARMSGLLRQYESLLQAVVASPDEPIASHSLVTEEARVAIPDPTASLGSSSGSTILDGFLKQAARVPGHVAVQSNGRSLTYAEVDSLSGRLAAGLVSAGITTGEVVGLYGARSPDLVWTLLGVLKAGAAFMILDPAYPDGRIVDCVRCVRPAGWIQVNGEMSPPAEVDAELSDCRWRHVVGVDELCGSDAEEEAEKTSRPGTLSGRTHAYVAFTSGTTGGMKAVRGTHGPVAHFLQWYTSTFELNEADRFVLLSGLAHDPLLRDIFTPLWLGATLCVPPDQVVLEPNGLAQFLRAERTSVAHLTPALGQLLAQSDGASDLVDLRYLVFGGDRLSRSLVDRLYALLPGVRCVNFYGATETPQAMASFVVDRAAANDGRTPKDDVPIGRGIDGVQLLILNEHGLLAGIGELGEVHVRTPHLTDGYMNDPALTAIRFVGNPFTGDSTDRLYRTGDLARYRPDGHAEFVGRRDGQVNIRGFRIELGEIEAALTTHPSVAQAVVVVAGTEDADRRLVGYVVTRPGAATTGSELRRHVRRQVPEYMLPAFIVEIGEIPLTPNGKVDRKALPDPFRGARPEREVVEPQSTAERAIAKIWQEALGIDRVGLYDNFFDLGGHSLLSIRVLARMERELGWRPEPRSMIIGTLRQIAAECPPGRR